MKNYPKLAEMGVMHPEQINEFMVNGISTYDVLRIIYKRNKGSFLPVSRYYKFSRAQKSVPGNGGKSETTVMETHPALKAAIAELEDLLTSKGQQQNLADSILEEVRLLNEDIAMRSECIKKLVAKI